MKVLIVNVSDQIGGAARAANRLHHALLAEGIDSQMLVQRKSSNDRTVVSIADKKLKLRHYLDAFTNRFYPHRSKTLFSSSWIPNTEIIKKINALNPDIVHLHWINKGMLRIEELTKIRAKIVWSLHDMWAFTGGCHYDEECGGFRHQCGNCKVLGSHRDRDLSRHIWLRKQRTYAHLPTMTAIGLSRWMERCATESTLFKAVKTVNLPNPIDSAHFKAIAKQEARALWNFQNDKQLILFAAMGALSDRRKGFTELYKALKKLKNPNIELVVLGSTTPEESYHFKFPTHYVGTLYDDISLISLYSAIDIMVVSSLQENLSNAVMESLSCSRPVVAFEIGGNSDMIDHMHNGYLAQPFDIADLANGIEWVLEHENYTQLCINAREKIIKIFDSIHVAKQYIALYKEILHD